MAKLIKSITLDGEVVAAVEDLRGPRSFSAFVNDLVKTSLAAYEDNSEERKLRRQMNQLSDRIDVLKGELEQKRVYHEHLKKKERRP